MLVKGAWKNAREYQNQCLYQVDPNIVVIVLIIICLALLVCIEVTKVLFN